MIDNTLQRYGSARTAIGSDIARAGMFRKTPGALFVGFFGNKPLWYDGAGGIILVAGARSGKLRDILAYNVCVGVCADSTLVLLDPKGELAAISKNQAADNKACYYWNPAGLHGLPQDRMNPVDYVHAGSPTLISDVKVLCENLVPLSGSANGQYFERRAREFLEAIILTLVRLYGVLTLGHLYWAVSLIPGGGNEWIEFAFEMSESGFEVSKRIEEEIAESRDNPNNGFQGILGEIFKAVAPLSNPVLLESVSPPFDFSMADTCGADGPCQVYLMPPAEFIDAWAPIIKAIFVAGMIYKSRAPQAPRQTWILDEAAQLGAFPLVLKLFSIGAGMGIRPWAVFQSTYQMKELDPNAENILTASAQLRCYFGLRDIESADTVSRMIGSQSLDYIDPLHRAERHHGMAQAAHAMVSGHDPLTAALQLRKHAHEMRLPQQQQRALRTPEEVAQDSVSKLFLFTDALAYPVIGNRQAYYDQRAMAGRYHPNPYHPPLDKVRVKTWFGRAWRRVIVEPVPERYAHLPQYKEGLWSRIES